MIYRIYLVDREGVVGRCTGVNEYQTAQPPSLHTSVTYPIHPILIYISFDIHIVSVCHTLLPINNVNTRLFRHRYSTRRRRCSRPRTRTMVGLTRRFVRDVRRRRIRLIRRRIWIIVIIPPPHSSFSLFNFAEHFGCENDRCCFGSIHS